MPRNASLRPMLTLGMLCLSALALGGCGYKTWWNPPFTTGGNPNQPATDSENARRVMGELVDIAPLTPEPGDIWPGPLPPSPTLADLQRGGLVSQPEQPAPGSPLRDTRPNAEIAPAPARGSSTPPSAPLLDLNAPPLPRVAAPTTPPPAAPRNPAGQILQTPNGPNVTTGGGTNYQTTVTPGGGSAIVVPNGNGTSTIIHPDGRIETVTTPK